MKERTDVRIAVRERYGAIAESGGCGCGGGEGKFLRKREAAERPGKKLMQIEKCKVQNAK